MRPSDEDISLELESRDWEGMTPQEALLWAEDRFHDSLRFASGFGMEGMAIIDLAVDAGVRPHVFYLDTDLLFDETYALIEKVRIRYGIDPERVPAEMPLEEQSVAHGERLWERNPSLCCAIRKVAPLVRYLSDKGAWVSGIRRDQSPTRRAAKRVEWDDRHGLFKINPICDWSAADVRQYIQTRSIPYNPLYDQGYPSIGCWPCTRPVKLGEDERAGRWAGFDKTECGLHGQG